MARVGRKSLQLAHRGLAIAKRKVEFLLYKKDLRREPYVRRLDEAYGRGWERCPCVFVLSTGRVGTTTLTGLLGLSPYVVVVHEAHPRLVKASYDSFLEGKLGATDAWKSLVLASLDGAIVDANRLGKYYVETNNRMTYFAGALRECFPASRFIFLHRHPYEVVRSGMRRKWYMGHEWDFARFHPRPGEPYADEWESMSPLEKCAWYWMRMNLDAHGFMKTLDDSKKLEIPAEFLFTGDESTVRKLFELVEVDVPERTLIEEVLGKRMNAQRAGEFPVPSEWSEAERHLVQRIVAPVAETLGYSL